AILVRKFLRDVWVALLVVALLLCAFQCLWAHVTQQITTELLPDVTEYVLDYQRKTLPLVTVSPEFLKANKGKIEEIGRDLQQLVFKGPGKIVQSLVGGENVSIT